MTYPATPEATRLLTFIAVSTADGGCCPSYAEMADHLGLKGRSGIHRMVLQLEERGLIRRLAKRHRAIEVTPSPSVSIPLNLYRALAKAAPREGQTIDECAADAIRFWLGADTD